MTGATLKVTSHVARDLLQSAALFKHEQTVVWEYVSNGLQYIDVGTQPVVNVEVDAKARKIAVTDNGRGMTAQDLSRYFQMHGENIDRKSGKAGRGMFGTGKSAAFGIGDTLRLTTVRNGKRSKVELERKDIEAASDGDGIPVKVIESEVSTREPNGTRIEVEDIHLKKLDIGSIIRHIERHIARWPNASVVVNHQDCNVVEPTYSSQKEFPTKGTPFEESLGDTNLFVKIAQAPLEPEWQGIAVLSNTVWHSSTLAGCENKPLANYIFGEIDVERLGKDKSPIPAFDMSRSMQLNPRNELVAAIFAFIGPHIESVRREIEKAEKERRLERDNKKLQEEASAIARIINQDFDAWRNQLKSTMSKVPGGKDKLARAIAVDEIGESIVSGDDFPATVGEETGTKEDEYAPNPEPNEPNPEPSPQPTRRDWNQSEISQQKSDLFGRRVSSPVSEYGRRHSSGQICSRRAHDLCQPRSPPDCKCQINRRYRRYCLPPTVLRGRIFGICNRAFFRNGRKRSLPRHHRTHFRYSGYVESNLEVGCRSLLKSVSLVGVHNGNRNNRR